MVKVHLDTDFGGDLDDFCALAMLLRWSPAIDLTGITVVGDIQGRRTGMVRYVLALEGRSDIPVAAGAETSGGYYRYELGLPPEERYWPHPITPSPNSLDQALELLKASIDAGAIIIGIGPLTNLYLLDLRYPGIVRRANLALMGGYLYPPRAGYPAWNNRDDFNIQADVRSAKHVLQQASPTLTPLSVTVETALRWAHLDRLRRAGGALGQLIAAQAEQFALDEEMAAKFGATCELVPEDIINFHHDPLACAIALGWRERIEIEEIPLAVTEEDGWLTAHVSPNGNVMRLATKVDGAHFSDFWLDVITQGRK
jgi:purine nucleosidase